MVVLQGGRALRCGSAPSCLPVWRGDGGRGTVGTGVDDIYTAVPPPISAHLPRLGAHEPNGLLTHI